MEYTYIHKENEKKDRRRSAVITGVIGLLVLLALYLYKFTRIIPVEEQVTTMLINFGDNRNGSNTEEPANTDGSLASSTTVENPDPVSEPQPQTPQVPERIITGSNTKVSAPKTEKKAATPKTTAKNTAKSRTNSSVKSTNSTQKASGDGQGTAAVGNLIRGRGTKAGTQGINGTTGNAGDPIGGDGNGDSKIGVDRKLIGFIPGTMGRGGSQPSHSCSASGTIHISYVVDKSGNVTTASRAGGIADPCAVSTTVAWVKRYVKAERANTSSTGTYRIDF